jgi:transcription initiation factor IIE alpha subunit
MANIFYAYCPECDTRIRFHKQPIRGDRITCSECMEQLEIVSTQPIELDWADEYVTDRYDNDKDQKLAFEDDSDLLENNWQ